MDKEKTSIEKSRKLINSEAFKERHRVSESHFTRTRKLFFSLLIIVIIRKSVKSMQLVLNELSLELDQVPVSVGAFTKARAKLKHTAFIELNREAVVNVCYGNDHFKTYKGFRVLGIDGSKLRLPDMFDVINEFGQISYRSNSNQPKGQHAYGLASVMYDVLNRIAVTSVLAGARSYEVDLAVKHLEQTQENDLLLCDREYPSYHFLATLTNKCRHFVIRCSAKSFSTARAMLKGKGNESQIVTLKVDPRRLKKIQALRLPQQITVRFVRVTLETGETEILVTSLADEEIWPTKDFKEIYWLRWGTEGFYDILKTRLELENFTGQTAESIYQDFYATVYLTGLESILTVDVNVELSEKEVCYPQQVNRIVSFNAIKNQAVEILFGNGETDAMIERLHQLFLTNPTCLRSNRIVPRQKSSSRKQLDYWKRRRKHCY